MGFTEEIAIRWSELPAVSNEANGKAVLVPKTNLKRTCVSSTILNLSYSFVQNVPYFCLPCFDIICPPPQLPGNYVK